MCIGFNGAEECVYGCSINILLMYKDENKNIRHKMRHTVFTLPFYLFNVEPVALKFQTQVMLNDMLMSWWNNMIAIYYVLFSKFTLSDYASDIVFVKCLHSKDMIISDRVPRIDNTSLKATISQNSEGQ